MIRMSEFEKQNRLEFSELKTENEKNLKQLKTEHLNHTQKLKTERCGGIMMATAAVAQNILEPQHSDNDDDFDGDLEDTCSDEDTDSN